MAKKPVEMSESDAEQFEELHPNSPFPTAETPAEEAVTEEATEAQAPTEEAQPAPVPDPAEPETPTEPTFAEALKVVFKNAPSGGVTTERGQFAWDGGQVLVNTLGVEV